MQDSSKRQLLVTQLCRYEQKLILLYSMVNIVYSFQYKIHTSNSTNSTQTTNIHLHVTLQILYTNSAHAMPFSHPISKDDSHPSHPNTHSSVSAEAETPPAVPADPAPPHGVWANADNWDTAVETTNAIPNYSWVRSGTEYGLYKSPPVGGWYAWLIRCY